MRVVPACFGVQAQSFGQAGDLYGTQFAMDVGCQTDVTVDVGSVSGAGAGCDIIEAGDGNVSGVGTRSVSGA